MIAGEPGKLRKIAEDLMVPGGVCRLLDAARSDFSIRRAPRSFNCQRGFTAWEHCNAKGYADVREHELEPTGM